MRKGGRNMKEKIGMGTGYEGRKSMYDNFVFKRHILDNNINVFLQKPEIITSRKGILNLILPNVGSQTDPRGLYGIAHFIEHLFFRGTKKRKMEDIIPQIKRRGGKIQGRTGFNVTSYSIEIDSEVFDFATDIMREIFIGVDIGNDNVNKERNTIIQEHQRMLGNENPRVAEIISKNLFVGSFDHLPGGFFDDINRISSDDIRKFYEDYYGSNNLSIICGGSFSEIEDVVSKLNLCFGDVKKSKEYPEQPKLEDVLRKDFDSLIKIPNIKRGYLIICYFFPRVGLSDALKLDLIAGLMGDNTGSEIFIKLREMGIVYEMSCDIKNFGDTSSFEFFCPANPDNLDFIQKNFFDFLKKLDKKQIISEQESVQLARANSFCGSVRACKEAIVEILKDGSVVPLRKVQDVRDYITVDGVMNWINYLLNHTPLILKVIPG